jgi:Domain of unknown function (DUF397)
MGNRPTPLGVSWRKSSYSQPSDSYCVETRVTDPGDVAVRDSKDPQGPQLTFTAGEWSAFVGLITTR